MGKYYDELFYLIFNQRTIAEKQELFDLYTSAEPIKGGYSDCNSLLS